ncbi:inositol monophosphatase family protein [Actinoplanes sp. KI2]|uniref:inositol monophosphatase family protein n=1 Tax=Actinoplanes sp. KI2 TaxID=2983315 RepID=UPI0021D5C04E|nr:inositol monophosphatase family protein [Actinoplanes sp. KI2]MCU7728994.1 inositol monophosphatase family protein [Actinoplanes sp. KI2]
MRDAGRIGGRPPDAGVEVAACKGGSGLAVLMRIALDAVAVASDMMRRRVPGIVTSKGDRDMASELDIEIEREVKRLLSERTPHIGILGEEEGGSGNPETTWVLDPIDGTANFLRGIPLCGVTLGLIEHARPTLGVISLPFLNETYSALTGQGAFSGRRRLAVSRTSKVEDAIAAIGDYAVGPGAEEKNIVRVALTGRLAATVQRIRMVGTAAADLAWLATGRIDASITLSNHPWDMLAGAVIAREAGAAVVDTDGSDYTLKSSSLIACTPGIATEMLRLVTSVVPTSA